MIFSYWIKLDYFKAVLKSKIETLMNGRALDSSLFSSSQFKFWKKKYGSILKCANILNMDHMNNN